MEKLLVITIMPSREVGESTLEVSMSGTHSRLTDKRAAAPVYLMDPLMTEMELFKLMNLDKNIAVVFDNLPKKERKAK